MIIHAGTSVDQQGNLISAGGRVLAVVGLGEDIAESPRSGVLRDR
jgi:phosphoribosylamine--glycine ligase